VNIKKRLVELERRLTSDSIILTMEDGTSQTIPLGRGGVMDLFAHVLANPSCGEADSILRSVAASEPGKSRIVEVCRALLLEPTENSTKESCPQPEVGQHSGRRHVEGSPKDREIGGGDPAA
jgi:hypothetical protein